ncbi:MAG: hypothetical protein ACPGUC_00230 [Gammaproteobacteria bacterium]
MMRSLIKALAFTAALFLPLGQGFAADGHKVVMHLDDNDPARMNLVLNNASNLAKHYQDKGEELQVEVVAYGPGLMMLHAKKSPVAERMGSFTDNFPSVSFKACANTMAKMKKKTGKDVPLFEGVEVVSGGVVHLLERQEQGWAYLRP